PRCCGRAASVPRASRAAYRSAANWNMWTSGPSRRHCWTAAGYSSSHKEEGWHMRMFAAIALCLAAVSAQAQIEKRDVHIAVGGKSALYYLPLTITERLGYFKDEGLNVRISDFAGGT